MNNGEKANLRIRGSDIGLPVHAATLGQDVVEVSSLVAKDIFTFDPGFVSTAACTSALTYIDGDAGVLLHRGYRIEELASESSHLELAYLLLRGDLPDKHQFDEFRARVLASRELHPGIYDLSQALPQDAHPMAILNCLYAALAAYEDLDLGMEDEAVREAIAVSLIAKAPTLVSLALRKHAGEAPIQPDPNLDYTENFLFMVFGDRPSAVVTDAMERIFILHADHEQNASTSTVRMAGSTGTNPYAAVAAGIGALWGPSHGGANEAVLKMLQEIGSVDNIDTFLARAQDPHDSFKLMGFGHRVYKNHDPRAAILRSSCHQVLQALGSTGSPLLKLAQELERRALQDEYFINRKLFPNVDFYSGIVLQAIGIPTSAFTTIFALSRTVGWIAQWSEMYREPVKIGRPRQLYVGPGPRPFVAMERRA